MQRGSMRGKIHPSGLDRTGIGHNPNYPELEPVVGSAGSPQEARVTRVKALNMLVCFMNCTVKIIEVESLWGIPSSLPH